jgi:hypothetical protein
VPVTDPEALAPSVRHTRRDDDCGRDREWLIERKVKVTNPDGSVTVHTFWTDTNTA